ncbi:MAG: SpoIIE family protein phosphatase [Oscillospiraceae bacterium]|nr:SpoIIE family protein phosphatase [Oscillospiraceae bacterium]
MGNAYQFFSSLIGTLAVILLVSAYAGSTQILKRYLGKDKEKSWKLILLAGVFGGLFGIYGNISGFELNGAVISVRDIGPMLSGFIGGPISGLLAGVIAGVHRLTMGGTTAVACVVATTVIGLACGVLSDCCPNVLKKFYWVLLIGAGMEVFHLCVVLLLVKPFETAFDIVKQIALPFVTVNAVGIMSMMGIIHFFEKQQALAQERERLKSELEVASVIQHSLLPTLNERYPGRPEIAVGASMQAAKQVGGDFYDVFFVSQDKLAFVIGDVSGKGVPAALFMASSKTILQNCLRDNPDPAEAFSIANNVLCDKNEAEMFVTVWAGILDLKDGTLTCASAGHNPPVLLHGGTAEFLKARNGFVLGGMEDVKYREATFRLEKGDALFLYTDGVTEAATAENELYGDERLLACLHDCADAAPKEVLETVKASLDAFVLEAEQFDDITMLCLRLTRDA